MNFKKRMGKFFTLTHKSDAGFTLVELIVVIAILAILAGVAVPAYSGYIEKSKRAADETLLAAVNTAYASACTANGSDIWLETSATASASVVGGKVTAITPAAYNEAFAIFFEGNEDAAFQVYTQLTFDNTKHVFVGVDEAAVIEALKAVIGNSSFNGNLEELTGDVGSLVGTLGEFLKTEEGKNQLLNSGFNDYLAGLGIDAATEENTQKIANAAVLYLAKSAASMTDEDIYNTKGMMSGILQNYAAGNGVSGDIINAMAGSTKSGLASYAALYATAEAIALQQPGGKDSDAYKQLSGANPNNPASVITAVDNLFNSLESDVILSYMGTEGDSQMSDDIDAYFQTLQAMNGKEAELKNQLESDDLFTTENATIKDLLAKLQG